MIMLLSSALTLKHPRELLLQSSKFNFPAMFYKRKTVPYALKGKIKDLFASLAGGFFADCTTIVDVQPLDWELASISLTSISSLSSLTNVTKVSIKVKYTIILYKFP